MDKQEKQAAIKLLFLGGLAPTEIKIRLDQSLGYSSPSFSTVNKWVAEFKRGNMTTQDSPRSGRPNMARSKEIVEKVEKLVLKDQSITLRKIAKVIGSSKATAGKILHDVLGMRKISGKWEPLKSKSRKKQPK
jgi:transposase